MAPPLVIGRYEVLDRLGKGGMGEVYLARDPNIHRLVALKLLPRYLDSGELRERFTREARAAGALGHPNIVTIHDFGEWQGAPFLVMEFIRGETIEALIKRRAPVPLRGKLQLLEQLCAGLGSAHAVGVVHRDIKPANLMVDQHGLLKILDFGIARLVDAQTHLTVAAIGTPRYMSPEQIDGGEVGAGSDIFSVGVVAFELLTYSDAFSGDTARTVMRRVQEYNPPPVSSLCAEAGPAIDAIVGRALEKDARRRFPDVRLMQAALQSVMSQLGPDQHPLPAEQPTRDAAQRSLPSADGGDDLDTLEQKGPLHLAPLLTAARAALASGNYDTAMAACREAVLIDSADASAAQLMRDIRLAKDTRHKLDLVAQARENLAAGNLTKAAALVGEASALDESDPDVVALRAEVDLACKAHEDTRWQEHAVRQACEHAQRYYADGLYDHALSYANEALAQDPSNAQALEIRRWCAEAVAPTIPALSRPDHSSAGHRRRYSLARRLGVPAAALAAAALLIVGGLVWSRLSPRPAKPGPAAPALRVNTPAGEPAASGGPTNHAPAGPARDTSMSSGPPRGASAPAANRTPVPTVNHPATIEDHLARGDSLRAQGQDQAAITEYDAALSADPTNRRAQVGRAAAVDAKVMATSKTPGSRGSGQQGIDEETRLVREADRLFTAGDYAAAVTAYDRVLAVNPKNEKAIAGKRNAVEAKVMRGRSSR